MIRRRFKLLCTHTSTSPSSGGIDGSSSLPVVLVHPAFGVKMMAWKPPATQHKELLLAKFFEVEKSNKASNVSNKDTAAAAGGTRRRCRRQPHPDGYLYDVSKTKEIQHMTTKKKSTAPSRNALDRGNHYQVERDTSSLTEQDLLFDGLRFVAYDEASIKQLQLLAETAGVEFEY
eukprot:scaffold3936_cov106-Skeletonema_menzelii.AAC.1